MFPTQKNYPPSPTDWLHCELKQPKPAKSGNRSRGIVWQGYWIGWQRAVSTYGENYQLLIRDENGTVTAAWLTAWLKENLKAQEAEQGDLVAITFLGKKMSPAGRPYNAYSIAVDKSGWGGRTAPIP